VIGSTGRATLLKLYEGMVRFRIFDTMLKRWVRQGVLNKAWLGTGEEAVSIGCALALSKGDVIGPMIRNTGACFVMGMPMLDHFSGYLGTTLSKTGGRDLHVGHRDFGVIAPISHVGSLFPVMCGCALGLKKRGSGVALTWVGDGATRTGEVHEAINYAAVEKLPIVVVIQNNKIALGTRTENEVAAPFEDWVRGYGIEPLSVDGNNVLDVFAAAKQAVSLCRKGKGPSVIVADTFRMGGHATHDEAEGRRLLPAEGFINWGQRDPIRCYEAWLVSKAPFNRFNLQTKGKITEKVLKGIEMRVNIDVEEAAEAALVSRETDPPDPGSVGFGVYSGEQDP
jgi:TPP-dependent pyruvate/acetoin dehydrogenase alpha subunit